MMRARLLALHARRGELTSRAAVERDRMAGLLDRTDAAGVWLNAASRLGAEAGRHPLLLVAVAAFVFALRPQRILGWLLRGWSLYQIYKRGLAVWQGIASSIAASPR